MLGRWLVVMAVAAAVAGVVGCGAMKKGEVASIGDNAFMRQAAHDGTMEVELGQVASQQAADPDVKAFGQRMVTDHSAANNKLMALGRSKNVDLPTAPTAAQRLEIDRLKGKTGADFDRAYMAKMVSDHEADIKAFEKEVADGKDPDVVAFAQQTLPTLREHLRLARETAAKVAR